MESVQFFLQLIPSTLAVFSAILISAAGGMICERSGIMNIALEGLMIFGAMTAAVTHVFLESTSDFSILISLFFAALAGGFFSLIHAFASVTLKADQFISGTGINLLSNGMTVFVCQVLFRMDRTPNYRMGIKSGLFGIYPALLTALLIFALVWFFLYKRPRGRAAGENPQSFEYTEVKASIIRFIAVLISGLLAGLAGGFIVLTQNIPFSATAVNGKGFIALAAVFFGRRLPKGVFGSCFLFSFVLSFSANIISSKSLQFLPPEIFYMLPFLITLLTLVVFGRRNNNL